MESLICLQTFNSPENKIQNVVALTEKGHNVKTCNQSLNVGVGALYETLFLEMVPASVRRKVVKAFMVT